MLNLNVRTTNEELAGFVRTAPNLRAVPDGLEVPVGVCWLYVNGHIDNEAAQQVLDAYGYEEDGTFVSADAPTVSQLAKLVKVDRVIVVLDDLAFDPFEHTVAEVKEFVAEHPEAEASVVAAELDGKGRVGIVGDDA